MLEKADEVNVVPTDRDQYDFKVLSDDELRALTDGAT